MGESLLHRLMSTRSWSSWSGRRRRPEGAIERAGLLDGAAGARLTVQGGDPGGTGGAPQFGTDRVHR
jgi:hypothetical protein